MAKGRRAPIKLTGERGEGLGIQSSHPDGLILEIDCGAAMMVQEVWSIFQHQGDEQPAAPAEMLEGLVVLFAYLHQFKKATSGLVCLVRSCYDGPRSVVNLSKPRGRATFAYLHQIKKATSGRKGSWH